MKNPANLLIILSAVLVLICSGSIFAQDPNFHIYLCFGQSNMSGNGDIEAQDLVTNSRFLVMRGVTCNSNGHNYTYSKWETALSPLNRCDSKLTFVDNFGKIMVNNLPEPIRVGVAIVAVGGSKIELFDKYNYANYVATAPAWMVTQINQFGGNPYARLVEMGKNAQKVGVIKGILFHQGESNNGDVNWPAKVKSVYDNLIADLGLDPQQTPFLAGELVTSAEGGACGGHNAIIAKIPSVIPNSYVISAASLPHVGDKLHFNSASCRIFGERYARKMLTLLPETVKNITTVSITTPSSSTLFTAPATISIAATATVSSGSISKVEFYNGTTKLGEDAISPYTYSWTGVAAGMYSITVVATDSKGAKTTSTAVSIKVNAPKGPFGGTAHTIPGKIEFENFDVGGNGVGYLDYTPGTSVPNSPNFRTTEDVDIENCTDAGTGYNIGYATAGEWLEYTVNVIAAGNYDLILRVACNGDGRTVSISAKDVVIAKDVAIPNTTGWQIWQDVKVSGIPLYAGTQVLRLTMGATDYVNLNYMTFAIQSQPVPTISLKAGWNLIGYPFEGSADIVTALSSVWANVLTVKNLDAFYNKSTPSALNSLTKLSWGMGYMVKVDKDCFLQWK